MCHLYMTAVFVCHLLESLSYCMIDFYKQVTTYPLVHYVYTN